MLTVFCPQLAIPIRELNRRFGQSFFNVNFPSSQANQPVLINATLAITLPESLFESCRFDRFALCDSEYFKRRSLLIIAKTMRPMWQAIVIANQFTMEGDGGCNQSRTSLRLACRDRSGENEALGVCTRDATANRLIADSVDPGIRQQYQRGLT